MSVAPTAQQLFGDSPWVTDPAPGGKGPSGTYLYSIRYFATVATAALVASIVELGCKFPKGSCKVVVVNDITPGGPFQQNQPNQMIQLPDGSLHNAGLIAGEFASWVSIEPINKELSEEFGTPFVYVEPPPVIPEMKPVPGVELLVGPVGKVRMQADGTFWKRVETAKG